MTVWIDAGQVTEIASTYLNSAAALRAAASRLRGDRCGQWSTDPQIAAIGTAFARLAATAAADLDRYAGSAQTLGDALGAGAGRLIDADLRWAKP